ncbi:cadherin-17 precursor [Xenopus tropicalis]|uniref:Cadherin-17 precursor n=1 Tax=Xenopus tropicalis TaxID=8364 RepID=B4F710_XENTR|nr:cadherin-17 precursor [Xenopus tropicalis]AAI68087.1 Unknown (protein for MGC:185926) [Xenopus tropicalis]|eukprot:NP_001135580.1 cadherin-17 precursor [Xenopus tropicalis]
MSRLKALFVLSFIQTMILVHGQLQSKGYLEDKEFTIQEEGRSSLIYQFLPRKLTSKTFILDGETDGVIEVLPHDGWLQTKGPLDWEKRKVHKLTIRTLNETGITEEGPFSITIIVEDINDNRPVFNQSEYKGEVREKYRPGRPFVRVYATDADDPSTPNAQLSYSILQQIPDSNPKYFQINNITGDISVTWNGSQLLTVGKDYNLIVQVSDSAEHHFSNTVMVKITIKENIWVAPPPITINENSTEPHPMKITQVRWNDDEALYELHQRDRYPRFPFSIDAIGDIYVSEPLDREERSQYIFYAIAKSRNGLFASSPLTIEVNVEDINDNPPVCPALITIFEVQENEGIGSTVGEFQASDADEEGSFNTLLVYRILEQIPTIPFNNVFSLNEFTGQLQLQRSTLNVEEVDEYILKVEVSDSGRPTSLKTICTIQVNVIDINDNIPIFEKSEYGNVTIKEDTQLQTVVMEIQATDDDQPNTGSSLIIYEIKEGDPHKMFIIETERETNRGYVKIAKPLDFETMQEHRLVIHATNPEPLVAGVAYNDSSITRFTVFVMDVDEKPYFNETLYQKQVKEDVPVGTKIATITAIDPEGDSIRFSLQGDTRNWLRIDEYTGEMFTKALLDRETESHYRVTVIASEKTNPRMSASVLFNLFLEDVNDNPPRLAKSYFGTYFCHPVTKPESVVIEATDPDAQRLTPFKFSLTPDEKDWVIVRLNRTHAKLTMAHSQFEMKNYDITVIINDQGIPPLESEVHIPVSICSCTSKNECEASPVESLGLPSIGMALGILFGTLAVIGVIIAAVFISINHKKKKEGKADGADAMNTGEIRPLSS